MFVLVSLTGAQGLSTAAVVVLHAKDGWDTSTGAKALRQVGGPRAAGMRVGHVVVVQAAVPMGHLLHKTQKQHILQTINTNHEKEKSSKIENRAILVLFIFVKTKTKL